MHQEQKLNSHIEQFLQSLNVADQEEETDQEEPEEIIDVYFVPREEPEEDVVEAIPAQNTRGPSSLITTAILILCLMLPLSSILFQAYLAFNPPTVTVTIIPGAKTVTLIDTLQLGRLVHPITLSQSQTVPTTGKGHQDAREATGTLTFYNGLFTNQTITTGTILTASDGVQVITDQEADIPAGNPPSYGQAIVAAHAVNPGERGNILAYYINQTCCASAVLAKNTTPFYNGQDARDFQTVTKRDIDTTAIPMKSTLYQGIRGALLGQLQPNEQLYMLPCTPIIASDHQPREEAAKVTITVSQTCDGIAYSGRELQIITTHLLTHQAVTKLGAGYTLLGNVQVIVHRATIIGTTPNLVFSSQGTWIYGLSEIAQEHLKRLIAGKTTQEAEHILSALPGIKNVAMQWDETTKLPKDPQHIKFLVLVEM
jgi:hypothetical protein